MVLTSGKEESTHYIISLEISTGENTLGENFIFASDKNEN